MVVFGKLGEVEEVLTSVDRRKEDSESEGCIKARTQDKSIYKSEELLQHSKRNSEKQRVLPPLVRPQEGTHVHLLTYGKENELRKHSTKKSLESLPFPLRKGTWDVKTTTPVRVVSVRREDLRCHFPWVPNCCPFSHS